MRRIKRSCLFINFILLFLGTLIITKPDYAFALENRQSDCVVTGRVQTNDVLNKKADGLPYTRMNLVFKNQSISRETKSDDDGNYRITLPVGIYEGSVKTDYNTFFNRRAAFKCQGKLVINIYPLIQQVSYGATPLNHSLETLGKNWTGSDKLNVVIAYLIKKKKKNVTTYQGNVYLTFDRYCIFAGEVVRDDKKKTLTAAGFAWIEDGVERKEVEKVTLKFSKDGLKIDF